MVSPLFRRFNVTTGGCIAGCQAGHGFKTPRLGRLKLEFTTGFLKGLEGAAKALFGGFAMRLCLGDDLEDCRGLLRPGPAQEHRAVE